jgi:hypothetical protein
MNIHLVECLFLESPSIRTTLDIQGVAKLMYSKSGVL